MDLDRIRYFKTIVETGSIKKAAELLHLSPPALSKAIKVLEAEIQAKLVLPEGRGIVITGAGRRFYSHARKLLQDYEELKSDMLSGDVVEKKLRIGSFEIFLTHLIGPILFHYFKDVSFFLPGLFPGDMEQCLVRNDIDIGITNIPVPNSDLDFLRVGNFDVGVFVGRKHEFDTDVFSEIPFVAPVTSVFDSPTRIKGLDSWPDEKLPRKIVYAVTMMETGLEICRQGLAAAYLPEFVVKLHNDKVKAEFQLVRIPMPKGVQTVQSVYLVKRKTDPEGQQIKRLAAALRKFCSPG